MSEFPLYPNAVDATDELARLRVENEQLREQVRARADQEAIDMALSRAVLAERELASVRTENERLTKRIDLFYEQLGVIEQQLGIEADSVTKTIGGEIERLQSELTALRRPVEQSEAVEAARTRDSKAPSSWFDGRARTDAEYCMRDRRVLLSTLETTARQLRERVEMLSFVQDSLTERNRECVELRERCGRLEGALKRIAKWHGEFPPSHRAWDDGSPMSYSAAFGSNGERDYMREIARTALAPGQQHTAGSGDGVAGD